MRLTNEKIILILVLTIIALGLILPNRLFINPVKGFFARMSSPVQASFTKAGNTIYDFFVTVAKIRELARENEFLKQENDKLLTEKSRFLEVEKENQILKNQLGFVAKNPSLKLVPGQVISRDPTYIQQYITINLGDKDGIKKDMPIVSGGFLVGRISDVFPTTARVFLITNPNSLVNAMIQESRATGVAKGQLGYGLILESIPQDVKINIGDLVVTSGLGDFPKGLLIGEVSEVMTKQAEIFQTATLRPLVDFAKLETVFIITNL